MLVATGLREPSDTHGGGRYDGKPNTSYRAWRDRYLSAESPSQRSRASGQVFSDYVSHMDVSRPFFQSSFRVSGGNAGVICCGIDLERSRVIRLRAGVQAVLSKDRGPK